MKIFPLTLTFADIEIKLQADGSVTGDLAAVKDAMEESGGVGNEACAIIWLVVQLLDLREELDEALP